MSFHLWQLRKKVDPPKRTKKEAIEKKIGTTSFERVHLYPSQQHFLDLKVIHPSPNSPKSIGVVPNKHKFPPAPTNQGDSTYHGDIAHLQ